MNFRRTRSPRVNKSRNHKGFALLLVLGLLVVLSLMAITFSAMVQADRKAGVMQFEKAKATMMIEPAVASAMREVEATYYPVPPTGPDSKIYPSILPRIPLFSQNTPSNPGRDLSPAELNQLLSIVNTGVAQIDNNYAGSQRMANFLRIVDDLALVLRNPENPFNNDPMYGQRHPLIGDPANPRWGTVAPQWVDIEDSSGTTKLGECAYILANLSGMYDYDRNTPTTARGTGKDGREIRIPFGTAIAGDPQEFIATTTHFSRNKLGTFSPTPWPNAFGNFRSSNPNILHPMPMDSNQPSALYTTADANTRGQYDQFFSELDSNFTSDQIELLQAAAKDFVDADNMPSIPYNDANGGTTEANPMFNEFIVDVTSAAAGGGGSDITVRLSAEFAYPFIEASGNYDYEIEGSVEVEVPADSWSETENFNESANIPVNPSTYPIANLLGASGHTFSYPGSEVSAQITVTITDPRITLAGAGPVDGFLAGQDLVFTGNIGLPIGKQSFSAEAIDPRFNVNPSLTADWLPQPAPTPGSINTEASNLQSSGNRDDGEAMYVRNAPFETAGELGYLPYDKWQTLCVYPRTKNGNTIYHRVYDFFDVSGSSSQTPQYVRRNMMNPNSAEYHNFGTPTYSFDSGSDRLLLSYVFEGAPIEMAPGIGGTSVISVNDANDMARRIAQNGPGAGNAPYIKPSDVLSVLDSAGTSLHQEAGIASGDDELLKESVYRNSMDLLNCRQNQFGMILLLRTNKEQLATEYVFVEIYRDAYPAEGATGRHAYSVSQIFRPSFF